MSKNSLICSLNRMFNILPLMCFCVITGIFYSNVHAVVYFREFCNFCNGTHAVCARRKQECAINRKTCGWTHKYLMNQGVRGTLMETVNVERSKLATGAEGPMENLTAANMNILNYDFELELTAQCIVNECPNNIDHVVCNRGRKQYTSAVFLTKEDPKPEAWIHRYAEMVQTSFLIGLEAATKDDILRNPNTTKDMYVFSRLHWAEAETIGCGKIIAQLTPNHSYVTRIVCLIGSSTPIQVGKPIYKLGKYCSQCPPNKACNTFGNHKGLCGTRTTFMAAFNAFYNSGNRIGAEFGYISAIVCTIIWSWILAENVQ